MKNLILIKIVFPFFYLETIFASKSVLISQQSIHELLGNEKKLNENIKNKTKLFERQNAGEFSTGDVKRNIKLFERHNNEEFSTGGVKSKTKLFERHNDGEFSTGNVKNRTNIFERYNDAKFSNDNVKNKIRRYERLNDKEISTDNVKNMTKLFERHKDGFIASNVKEKAKIIQKKHVPLVTKENRISFKNTPEKEQTARMEKTKTDNPDSKTQQKDVEKKPSSIKYADIFAER